MDLSNVYFPIRNRQNIRVTATNFRTVRTVSRDRVTSAEITYYRNGVPYPYGRFILVITKETNDESCLGT